MMSMRRIDNLFLLLVTGFFAFQFVHFLARKGSQDGTFVAVSQEQNSFLEMGRIKPNWNVVILRNKENAKKNVAIVTINTGHDANRYNLAIDNFKRYADCHGYKFYNGMDVLGNPSGSIHPYMLKVYALLAVVEQHKEDIDMLIWIDRDAIFADHRMSVEALLEKIHEDSSNNSIPYDFYIAVEPWAWLNTGVMIVRNTPFSRQLLKDWKETYAVRSKLYASTDQIMIQGKPKFFRDLFDPKWSCEDQGALIALLAGYTTDNKWYTDRYDGLGKPHLLHQGDSEWADLSSRIILAPKYHSHVKIVSQERLNTNPWDHEKLEKKQQPFAFHFNGQPNKLALIAQYSKNVVTCPKVGGRLPTAKPSPLAQNSTKHTKLPLV